MIHLESMFIKSRTKMVGSILSDTRFRPKMRPNVFMANRDAISTITGFCGRCMVWVYQSTTPKGFGFVYTGFSRIGLGLLMILTKIPIHFPRKTNPQLPQKNRAQARSRASTGLQGACADVPYPLVVSNHGNNRGQSQCQSQLFESSIQRDLPGCASQLLNSFTEWLAPLLWDILQGSSQMGGSIFEDSKIHYPPDESRLITNDILFIMIYIYIHIHIHIHIYIHIHIHTYIYIW